MNKYFDLNRSTSTVRPQPFDFNRSTSTVRPHRSTSTVRPQPFTGINSKTLWVDVFSRAICSKIAQMTPS